MDEVAGFCISLFSFLLQDSGGNDDASDEDESLLGFWTSIGWLTILTIFISILSEYLVDAIEVCVSAFQQIT